MPSKSDLDRALADYNEAIRIDPSRLARSTRCVLRSMPPAATGSQNDRRLRAGRQERIAPNTTRIAHKAVAAELELKTQGLSAELRGARLRSWTRPRLGSRPRNRTPRHDALEVLQTIDGILLRRRFVTIEPGAHVRLAPAASDHGQDLLAIASDPQTYSVSGRGWAKSFHVSTPLTETLIYASIGQLLGLPIEVALTPGKCLCEMANLPTPRTSIGIRRSVWCDRTPNMPRGCRSPKP